MNLLDEDYVAPAKLLSGKVSMEYRSLFIACLNLASLIHSFICEACVTRMSRSIISFSSQAPVIF